MYSNTYSETSLIQAQWRSQSFSDGGAQMAHAKRAENTHFGRILRAKTAANFMPQNYSVQYFSPSLERFTIGPAFEGTPAGRTHSLENQADGAALAP